jgi:GT2 family glycosyltransferase
MTNWVLTPVVNGVQLTRAAVKTFLKQDIGNVRVMLIDNATTDGTAEWARSRWPEVVVCRRRPALSVAASWNKGLTLLFEDTPNEHVLVVNNDTELRPDTYRLLVEDGGEFVTAVSDDNPDSIKVLTPPNGKTRPHPDFSCFLIRRAVWEKVGRFDEEFKIAYVEDLDYHLRMHNLGIDAHCIDLPFYHKRGSATANSTPEQAAAIAAQAELNRAYFAKKWGVQGGTDEYYAIFKNTI